MCEFAGCFDEWFEWGSETPGTDLSAVLTGYADIYKWSDARFCNTIGVDTDRCSAVIEERNLEPGMLCNNDFVHLQISLHHVGDCEAFEQPTCLDRWKWPTEPAIAELFTGEGHRRGDVDQDGIASKHGLESWICVGRCGAVVHELGFPSRYVWCQKVLAVAAIPA